MVNILIKIKIGHKLDMIMKITQFTKHGFDVSNKRYGILKLKLSCWKLNPGSFEQPGLQPLFLSINVFKYFFYYFYYKVDILGFLLS